MKKYVIFTYIVNNIFEEVCMPLCRTVFFPSVILLLSEKLLLNYLSVYLPTYLPIYFCGVVLTMDLLSFFFYEIGFVLLSF